MNTRWPVFLLTVGCALGCGSENEDGNPEGIGESLDLTTCQRCDFYASCVDGACVCNAGFAGDGLSCIDIDECAVNNGGCDANARCIDRVGARICECPPGFSGDGITCTDPCEADGGCGVHAECVVSAGVRACECQEGFVGDGRNCERVWTQVAVLPDVNLAPEPNYADKAAVTVTGSRIYFAPTTNQVGLRFMRFYDVSKDEFSEALTLPPGSQTDFCVCGATEVFAGVDNRLYLLGNDGQRYNINEDSWQEVSGYRSRPEDFTRAEAAVAFDDLNGVLMLIGGRDTSTTAIVMDVQSERFDTEPGQLPLLMDNATAYSPPGSGTVYVGGGTYHGGRGFLRHETETDVWTPLAMATSGIVRGGMGHYGELVWVVSHLGRHWPGLGLAFYDPSENRWLPSTVALPTGFQAAVTLGEETYIIVDNDQGTELINDNSVEIYRLNAIE